MELRSQLCRECSHDYITPSDERWAEWLEESFPGEYRVLSRYAMRRDRNHFSEEKLEKFAATLPEGIHIRQIDKRLYRQAKMCIRDRGSRSRAVSWFDSHLTYLFRHGNHEFFK